jgi:hypothetical protein
MKVLDNGNSKLELGSLWDPTGGPCFSDKPVKVMDVAPCDMGKMAQRERCPFSTDGRADWKQHLPWKWAKDCPRLMVRYKYLSPGSDSHYQCIGMFTAHTKAVKKTVNTNIEE